MDAIDADRLRGIRHLGRVIQPGDVQLRAFANHAGIGAHGEPQAVELQRLAEGRGGRLFAFAFVRQQRAGFERIVKLQRWSFFCLIAKVFDVKINIESLDCNFGRRFYVENQGRILSKSKGRNCQHDCQQQCEKSLELELHGCFLLYRVLVYINGAFPTNDRKIGVVPLGTIHPPRSMPVCRPGPDDWHRVGAARVSGKCLKMYMFIVVTSSLIHPHGRHQLIASFTLAYCILFASRLPTR